MRTKCKARLGSLVPACHSPQSSLSTEAKNPRNERKRVFSKSLNASAKHNTRLSNSSPNNRACGPVNTLREYMTVGQLDRVANVGCDVPTVLTHAEYRAMAVLIFRCKRKISGLNYANRIKDCAILPSKKKIRITNGVQWLSCIPESFFTLCY